MLNLRTLAAAAALAAIALMVPSTSAHAAPGDKPANNDTRVVQHAWSWQG